MKIALLGTRGVPNHHGGFEQFAEYFSVYLANKGHEVYVYNSHDHPYKEKTYKGVNIVHCFDAESRIGTAGQFIYDFNCIIDSRSRNFDIILQLGYTSSSLWYWLLPKKPLIITNMDGLEWKRTKYSKKTRDFLKKAEKWAAMNSDYLISDSIGIKSYLKETYNMYSKYIAYGSNVFNDPNVSELELYGVKPKEYNMLIARLEPENNIETILNGVVMSTTTLPFLVIGKLSTKFGGYLKNKFKDEKRIIFLGGVYNQNHLNNLRYFSNLYFHGHSVGGTNPSLLEAMASCALIIAHDNVFNKSVLEENAFYFTKKEEIATFLNTFTKEKHQNMINGNINKINNDFNWDKINQEYLNFFIECFPA
ncbi:DUF1972 domain-containing protein [Maribacter arcticus]|uniref:Glycosyltransferase involved in cell wall bisynthesis n=1 Tax=Maribacter arcticus TaxID=561365 RepID=A0A1T5BUW2_9FLAO|nr:DUF1972 domain-containing protein [Maribacter arcticus]SKB50995.1 Glycosyltransferase involved in cell wall bisynthesis [Maribacter arcticus]